MTAISSSLSIFFKHNAVSISSSYENEMPCPWFKSLITSTFPVSVFTVHGSRMCLGMVQDPPLTANRSTR